MKQFNHNNYIFEESQLYTLIQMKTNIDSACIEIKGCCAYHPIIIQSQLGRQTNHLMESINAKAIYLKQYTKAHKTRSPFHQQHQPTQKNWSKTEHSPHNNQQFHQPHPKHQQKLAQISKPKLKQGYSSPVYSMALKQKHILLKVAESKSKQKTNNKILKETIYSNMRVTKFNHKEAQRLQLSLTKPTDQLFHQLENVRLAERLLFAKATRETSLQSLKSFYKIQRRYKSNISKMPSFSLKQRKTKPNSKSWLD